jgi:hypothetical protein
VGGINYIENDPANFSDESPSVPSPSKETVSTPSHTDESPSVPSYSKETVSTPSFTKEVPSVPEFYNECMWRTQEYLEDETEFIYFDDIDFMPHGGMASDVDL